MTAPNAGLASVTVEGAQNFTTNDPRFDPDRSVAVNGFLYQRAGSKRISELVVDVRAVGREEFAAELGELSTLLNDAEPAVRFVNSLATMTDEQADALRGRALREKARQRLGDDGFVVPAVYNEDQRLAAVEIIREMGPRRIAANHWGRLVDDIAAALGLERIKP